MIQSGVFATNTLGITRSRFRSTDSNGFSNSTVIAHIVAILGSMVRNKPTHHFNNYIIGSASVIPVLFAAINPVITKTTRKTTISISK